VSVSASIQSPDDTTAFVPGGAFWARWSGYRDDPPLESTMRSAGTAESIGQNWRLPWPNTTPVAPAWASELGSTTDRTVSSSARSVFRRAY
jgi:hypothetical protein